MVIRGRKGVLLKLAERGPVVYVVLQDILLRAALIKDFGASKRTRPWERE